MGFTCCATAFDNDDVIYRLAFLMAMLGTIAMAASASDAVHGHPEGFVLAYAALRSVVVGFLHPRVAVAWGTHPIHRPGLRACALARTGGGPAGAAPSGVSLIRPGELH